jgi:hypothetical protein
VKRREFRKFILPTMSEQVFEVLLALIFFGLISLILWTTL